MASQLRSGSATYGQWYELYAITAVVVGGTSLSGGEGTVGGTLVGAFTIAVIANGMNLFNIESTVQRIVLGFVIGWGNLNGIVSSNIFYQSPKYTVGHATIMAYMIVCLFGGSCLMTYLLRRENARARRCQFQC